MEDLPMKKTLRAVAFAVPFVLAGGLASAAEPMQLSDNEMDGVTAGAIAVAEALATAMGVNTAFTETITSSNAAALGSVTIELTTITLTGVESAASSAAFAD
jgi:O-antigen ligase